MKHRKRKLESIFSSQVLSLTQQKSNASLYQKPTNTTCTKARTTKRHFKLQTARSTSCNDSSSHCGKGAFIFVKVLLTVYVVILSTQIVTAINNDNLQQNSNNVDDESIAVNELNNSTFKNLDDDSDANSQQQQQQQFTPNDSGDVTTTAAAIGDESPQSQEFANGVSASDSANADIAHKDELNDEQRATDLPPSIADVARAAADGTALGMLRAHQVATAAAAAAAAEADASATPQTADLRQQATTDTDNESSIEEPKKLANSLPQVSFDDASGENLQHENANNIAGNFQQANQLIQQQPAAGLMARNLQLASSSGDLKAAAGHQHYKKKKKKKKKKKVKIVIKKKKKKKKYYKKKKKVIIVKKKKKKKKKHVHQYGGHHGGGHHGGGYGKYYMYAKVPKKKAWEFGYKKGNKKHTISRHEKGYKNKFKTKVTWHDKKSKGKGVHIWDYNHHDKKKKKKHY